MSRNRIVGFASLTALCTVGCLAGAAPALAGECHQVRAQIVDSQTSDGCSSPNAFCAAGTVVGNRGLNGTTYFTMDGAVRGPASAPGFLATSGILVYTTHRGTLTVRETGVSKAAPDASSGLVSAVQEVISGTGKYAGATGHLYVASEAADGEFFAEVTGELCLQR
jgi:hypothetical protein